MVKPIVKELRERVIPFSNPWRPGNADWNPLGHDGGTTLADAVRGLLVGDPWGMQGLHAWVHRIRAAGVLRRGAKAAIENLAKVNNRHVTDQELVKWFEPGALEQLLRARDRKDYRRLLSWW